MANYRLYLVTMRGVKRFEPIGRTVECCKSCAFLDESVDDGVAKSGCTAGNQNDLAFELCHSHS